MDGPNGKKIFQPTNGKCHHCGGEHVKMQCAKWIDTQLAYGDDKGKKAVAEAKALMEKYGGEERVE